MGSDGHDVFRNMYVLFLGGISARLITIATVPLLSRIYSPEDFGFLSIFTSIIKLMTPILTLQYVLAIPLPKNDIEAANIFSLSILLIINSSLLISIIIIFVGPALLHYISAEKLLPYTWLIMLGIVGAGSYQLIFMWAIRKKMFTEISKTQVWQTLIGSIVKLVLGIMAMKP